MKTSMTALVETKLAIGNNRVAWTDWIHLDNVSILTTMEHGSAGWVSTGDGFRGDGWPSGLEIADQPTAE